MLRLILLLFLSIFFNQFSLANDEDNKDPCLWENSKIPCIEIKGYIPNSSKFSTPGINKRIIKKKDIIDIGAVDLIDILKSIPDINITQSGPKGQQASLFFGGTGSNHTLVMINGIPINDQSTTQGLHDFGVDFIQTIQKIEIFPGSSASHFGTNAIGGAINIILEVDYKDSFKFSSDKDVNYELAGNKTYVFDSSSLNLKVGSVKNETISARGNSDDENDELKNYSANINYENFLNNNTRLYNTFYLRQTKAEYDNSSTNQTGYKGDNKMGSFQLGLENLDQSNKYNYILYYNAYDRKYDERGTADTYESKAIGLKYDLSKVIDDKFSFGLGSDYKYDWGYFDNNGSYQASTKGYSDNLAIYGNIGWNIFQKSTISFFGRNDDHKQTGRNNTLKINFEQKFMNSNLGFSFMNGLRNPTLYEMYGTDNYGYSGNRNLDPEKSNTLEVYSNIAINQYLALSLRSFKSNIKNNIEYINNQYQNDSDNVDLNQSGLNSELNYKTSNTNISIFSSLLSSKKENGTDQLRRPEKNYGVNLSKKFNSKYFGIYKLNILYNHYGKHFDTHSSSFSTIEMDSTDVLDMKLTKNINNRDYYIKISNLFDENYQRPHGYNQEGRILKFGFNY